MCFSNPEDALDYLKTRVSFNGMGVVLDIDDTVLKLRNKQWKRVEYIYEFYLFLQRAGARIYFVTARKHSDRNLKQTLDQLYNFGFLNFEGLFLMNLATGIPATVHNIAWFKSTIRNAIRIAQNISISLSVGNQWQDLLLPQYIDYIQKLPIDEVTTYVIPSVGENIAFLVKLPTRA
jgi:predicted secreted acid phosphatase